MGVGAGAFAFHCTDGQAGPGRLWARRVDYWMIATATAAMVRAVFPGAPCHATRASLAATPFQPFSVSAANILAMEREYLRRARAEPGPLRRAHAVHVGACGVGLACFFLEDLMPRVPGLHSAWHCFSAVGLATTGPLLRDVERMSHGGGEPKCAVA